MAFIRLGLAGTKCGSSSPRHRLTAVTCLPPTNWATEARSVSDVATLRSAWAGAAASAISASTSAKRNGMFIVASLESRRGSVRMGRVVADRVAHLQRDPVVGRVDAGVGRGVAVLEAEERELRGRPGDVH